MNGQEKQRTVRLIMPLVLGKKKHYKLDFHA